MASLTDSPGLVASREAASRNQRLLSKAYRDARRRGDNERAYKIAGEADAQGLPVGRTAHAEEIAGTGEANYFRNLKRAGIAAPKGGLDGYDFSQKGVGYDFTHSQDQQSPESEVDTYRKAYFDSGDDPEAQNQIISRANAQGIPLSDYGRSRLLRSSILKGQTTRGYQPGTPVPDGSTIPKSPAPITSPGGTPSMGSAGGDYGNPAANFQGLLSKRNQGPVMNNPATVGDGQSILPPPAEQIRGLGSRTMTGGQGPLLRGVDNYARFKGPIQSGPEQVAEINGRLAPEVGKSWEAQQRLDEVNQRMRDDYARRGTDESASMDPAAIESYYNSRMSEMGQREQRLRRMSEGDFSRIGEGEDEIGARGGLLRPRRDSSSAFETMRRLRRLF